MAARDGEVSEKSPWDEVAGACPRTVSAVSVTLGGQLYGAKKSRSNRRGVRHNLSVRNTEKKILVEASYKAGNVRGLGSQIGAEIFLMRSSRVRYRQPARELEKQRCCVKDVFVG